MFCRGFQPFNFILQAQFSTFDFSNFLVVRRRGSENIFELFLQSTVFLFK